MFDEYKYYNGDDYYYYSYYGGEPTDEERAEEDIYVELAVNELLRTSEISEEEAYQVAEDILMCTIREGRSLDKPVDDVRDYGWVPEKEWWYE